MNDKKQSTEEVSTYISSKNLTYSRLYTLLNQAQRQIYELEGIKLEAGQEAFLDAYVLAIITAVEKLDRQNILTLNDPLVRQLQYIEDLSSRKHLYSEPRFSEVLKSASEVLNRILSEIKAITTTE